MSASTRVAIMALLALAACDATEVQAPLPTAIPAESEPSEAPAEAPQGEHAEAEPEQAATETGSEAAPAAAEGEAPADAEAPNDTAVGGEEPAIVDGEPRKVLMVGSSIMATGFGALLEKRLDANPNVICFRKGKSASGLARPDFFDWVDTAKRQVEFREPDVVVINLGGNDGQDLRGRGPKGRWDTDAWKEGYRARVDDFLDEFDSPGRKVLWLGLLETHTRKYEAKLDVIRLVHKEAMDARGEGWVYLDTTTLMTDEKGELMREVRVNGKVRELRGEDGIHLTMTGSEYLAEKVEPIILNLAGLAPVEDGS